MQNGNAVPVAGKFATVTVALVGLHVVGTTINHPEFLWATFEHKLNSPEQPDNWFAPNAQSNPKRGPFLMIKIIFFSYLAGGHRGVVIHYFCAYVCTYLVDASLSSIFNILRGDW